MSRRCEGCIGPRYEPECDGPNPRLYIVKPDTDEPEFHAFWCDDCAWLASHHFGYAVQPIHTQITRS